MTRKELTGVKYRWEPVEPFEGGYCIADTRYGRGSSVTIGDDTHGRVLGTSVNGEWVGVLFDDCERVTEYTLEQFHSRFA